MIFSTDNPVPFTVKDLKEHLEYMKDDMPIRFAGTNKYLALVGCDQNKAVFAFNEDNYFTGYDFKMLKNL